jgi:hypothetical protein
MAEGSGRASEISEVLAGRHSYDDLDGDAQAVVRNVWDQRIAAAREQLDLEEEFRAAGVSGWATADEQGRAVIHP